jgi:hypothetical protein
MLEAKTWEFRRGLSKKQSKEEKFTVKLWKKFGYILNQIATDKKVKNERRTRDLHRMEE